MAEDKLREAAGRALVPGPYHTYHEWYMKWLSATKGDPVGWKKAAFMSVVRDHLPRDRRAALLELGCGLGLNIAALQEAGYTSVVGVDLDGRSVAYARDRLGLRSIVCADAADWCQGHPESYDCILAIDLLEHIPLEKLPPLMISIGRALRAKGRLIAQVPNALAPCNPLFSGDITHQKAFTVWAFDQLCQWGGLRLVSVGEVPPFGAGLRTKCRKLLFGVVKLALRGALLAMYGSGAARHPLTGNILFVAVRDRYPFDTGNAQNY